MTRRSTSPLAFPPFPWELEERAGEGATAVVWRARDRATGDPVAIKIARGGDALLHEAELVARVGWRWGPSVVGAGRLPAALGGMPAGAAYVVTEWADGASLRPLEIGGDRERVAAVVAHGVGRALAELHASSVRHGDVKPANVVLAGRAPSRDEARGRGATLIDLGLATGVGDTPLGASPRYAAPELASSDGAGPEADLFALGLMLAEVLDPAVARAIRPRDAMAAWGRAASSEPARWAEALTATAPGGRPRAQWIADRAARWLDLQVDPREEEAAREALVRRAYLAVRRQELRAGARVATAIDGPARAWLESALAWTERALGASYAAGGGAPDLIAPLGPVHRARWLVALVGPVAATWPRVDGLAGAEGSHTGPEGDGALASRLVALARVHAPSAWTLDDVRGTAARAAAAWDGGEGAERAPRLLRELGRARPHPGAIAAAEEDVARGRASAIVAVELARALVRAGESGRAWSALATIDGEEADALRAEVARRRGDRVAARAAASRAATASDAAVASSARATLARLAWDDGDLDAADRALHGASGPAAAEVRALVSYRRGALDAAVTIVTDARFDADEPDASARLEATRGFVEHARGNASASLDAFGRAVELATRAGAVVEEATYLTGEAAAATDTGAIDRALASATRAALLWERLGRRGDAARAWLSRAGALATIGATHAADEAAEEATRRAREAGDTRAEAYARWATVETRPAGDARAHDEAVRADAALRPLGTEDAARGAARLLVWAPDAIDDARVAAVDRAAATLGAPARWEWWGARASAILAGRRAPGDDAVHGALVGLLDVPAPLGSRGPALEAASRLALERGDGDAARRFDDARRTAARALHDGTPAAWRASLSDVAWARASGAAEPDVSLASAQITQLETIVRALGGRDRLRPLLEQVLDAMVLWTGVERGLLLLTAPDGRLVPRAARNLARHDLKGEQLVLSQGIARRAMETGDAVVATDAYASLGDMHASVHALRLRSVLAVPLIARGETLGVVYLDDRARRGAFGARELSWVRLVASQAAMAIADARDQVMLKRAVRRSERAGAKLATLLSTREAELDATRTELRITRGGPETRFPYEAITGRSEPMRAMLQIVDKVTSSDVPVLIAGESGTGKELIARAIHANGARGRRPFVSENCASVPESLLESTLFGHVRGAFTGASSTRAGLFDVADGGTLFLDEIGEMSVGMQSKLLRVLQDGEVRAVGGERTRKVDVRVIAATHRDLEAMVAAGTFREDLFYRLNVIAIRVPALRERADDVPLLVAHFLAKHAADDHRRALKVTRAAMDRLLAYPWPGNVRQLENEIRRALVLAEDRIDVAELSSDIARGGPAAARGSGLDLRSRVDALEADLVREALAKTGGNQTRAAEVLGLSRFGLQKMMKRLNVKARG
jgi:serine/threonine-protein kinase PknK